MIGRVGLRFMASQSIRCIEFIKIFPLWDLTRNNPGVVDAGFELAGKIKMRIYLEDFGYTHFPPRRNRAKGDAKTGINGLGEMPRLEG